MMSMDKRYHNFFTLLRYALKVDDAPVPVMSEEEWNAVYLTARKQTVTGVVYQGVKTLPDQLRPPKTLLLTWAVEAERIAEMNKVLTNACRELTLLFGRKGRRTAILKGQANAMLYPEPLSRQPGDVDIWVEGGKDNVTQLLDSMGLQYHLAYHHAHLTKPLCGAHVEVHFRPSSGNRNPLTNRHLQKVLEKEILKSKMTTQEFVAPTLRFALIMQMAHIQRHFVASGLGLRHLTDYFMLLKRGNGDVTEDELRRMGLRKCAGAVMWVMGSLFGLERAKMICPPDEQRGRQMLENVLAEGNFGHYDGSREAGPWQRLFHARKRRMAMFTFNPAEAVWLEMKFWKAIIETIPQRIKARSWSLADAERRKGGRT